MSDSDEAYPARRLADRIERLRDPLTALVEAVSPPPERGPRPSAGDPGPWEGPSDRRYGPPDDERAGDKEDEEPGAAEERGPDAP
ncbi:MULTISPECIES: hypothetical protein [unclassified Streptomyces]|uniref:hypothetical protein n=1 Tax=unclassified Streptomyces TaxID=2593676 RepID=UPI00093C3047|nr:hypothetical protein [Streptomyces sp. CB02058]OKI92757.1 hypothetical protein AMK10_23960 [Streptomyces sp. CB02058]